MRETTIFWFLILAISAFAGPSFVCAQSGSIAVQVLDDTGDTLPNAHLELLWEADRVEAAISDGRGRYLFDRLSEGQYVIRTSFLGFETALDTVRVGADQRIRLDIVMRLDTRQMREIVVESPRLDPDHAEPGLITVRPGDLVRVPMPDVSYDLAGYLLTLPGIVSTGDRGGQLFVRGGTSTQNLVLLDGMPVFQPFHIVGFYSAFPADIVSYADVYAGGFGARYGGRISSVIDVATRNGNKQSTVGSVSISPFLSSFRIETPLKENDVSLLVSVRESVVDRVSSSVFKEHLPFRFGDRFAKLHAFVNPTSSVSLTALQTYDQGNVATVDPSSDAGQAPPGEEYRKSTWKNEAYGGRFTYLPDNKAVMTQLSTYYTRLMSRYRLTADELRTSNISQFSLEVMFAYLFSDWQMQFAVFGTSNFYDFDLGRLQRTVTSGVSSGGVYMDTKFNLSDHVRIEPGFRLEAFTRGRKTTLGPRMKVILLPGGGGRVHRFSVAYGRYHQQIIGVSNEQDISDVFTVWAANPKSLPVPRSTHYIAAWSGRFAPWIETTIEAYLKKLEHLAFPVFTEAVNELAEFSSVDGKAKGVDARVEINRPTFYFSVGYGWSNVEYHRSTQFSRGLFRPGTGKLLPLPESRFHPAHDRRHQVNVLTQLRFGHNTFGARWQFGSGLPFTQVNGYFTGVPDVEPFSRDHLTTAGRNYVSRSEPFAARQPPYHRLDITYERSFQLVGNQATAQAGFINVYDRDNIFEYNIFTGQRVNQLPIIPSLGLKVDFR